MSNLIKVVKNKLSFLLAVTLATFVGGATTAIVMASIPDAGGVIHGCIRNNGDLRIIDTATDTCSGTQTPLSWDQSAQSGHYQKVSYTLNPDEFQTHPFFIPASDTTIRLFVATSSVEVDCANGVIETLNPSAAEDILILDSATGRFVPDQESHFSIGSCLSQPSGQVEGIYSFDTANNTITVGNVSTEQHQLTSPVTFNLTFWY